MLIYFKAPDPSNAYVTFQGVSTNTYGSGFNAIGGGVYATQWNSAAISIWFFPRDSIPSNIQSANPDPSTWGKPLSQFSGACNIDNYIHSQQIVSFLYSKKILRQAPLMSCELTLTKSPRIVDH